MEMLGSTEGRISKGKNDENVQEICWNVQVEITEVVFFHCNIVNIY